VDFSNILNVLLAAALAGLGALYKSSRDERAQLAARLAESKRAMYELYVDVLRDVAAETKGGKNATGQQHIAKLRNFAFRSMLIASDDVVRAHIRFMNVQRISAESVGLPAIADVVHALRRDIGFPNTEITARQLLGVFVNEIDSDSLTETFRVWEAAKKPWDRKMGWS
jgi:hypothetical protein